MQSDAHIVVRRMSGLSSLKLNEKVPEAFVLMLREQILAENEWDAVDGIAPVRAHYI